jgi:hypothetical protein
MPSVPDALESHLERVTALEEALKKAPAEACSYCGEGRAER